ncbi:N-terminal binuclear Zn cluster-containing/DNA binding domain-containing protein [Trichoderma chlorosporum]
MSKLGSRLGSFAYTTAASTMNSDKSLSKPRRGRTVTACLECRKMKKCDRQWPCNHCTSRKMTHNCQFSQAPATERHRRTNDAHMSAVKETPPTTSSLSVSRSQGDAPQVTDSASAMHMLGYMHGENDAVFGSIRRNAEFTSSSDALSSPILEAARIVPPRPYTDILVKNFFDSVNYHYGILYQPSFMAVYVDWWLHRREAQSFRNTSTIALTCLILRICANSTQYLSPQTSSKLELDLGDSVQNLSKSYHDAAQNISNCLSPGSGGLVHAQQLFLSATWHKGEADVVRSWHELGAAVRQAQEIGVHMDLRSDQMSEFDLEIRRRLWCALYTWDRYMTAIFNRPLMIQSDGPVTLPNPALDQPSINPNIPSYIVSKILENKLARQLMEGGRVNEANLQSKIASVESWMSSLPPAFRVVNPDRQWDDDYPHIPFQRLQLHCAGYMTQVILLRSILLSTEIFSAGRSEADISSESTMLLYQIVDVSLKAMLVSKETFDICFPQQARYYMVSFCPFDNAALLCSLLIHDVNGTMVPRRIEVVHAIGQALHIAHCLRGFTKMGEATWSILSVLKNGINLYPPEREILDGTESIGTDITKPDVELGVDSDHASKSSDPFNSFADENLQFMESTLAADGAEFLDMDLGILEGVWNWDRVGF